MKSLDSAGECLNNLASYDLVSNESIVYLTTVLERTRLYFDIFKEAIQAYEDLKAATDAQEVILPELEAIKAKKEKMANLDCQICRVSIPKVCHCL